MLVCVLTDCGEGMTWSERRLRTIKNRCNKKGIVFDLSSDYLQSLVVERCPVSGIILDYSKDVNLNTATVDRIDPEKGYVEGNVEILSSMINNIKSIIPANQMADIHYKMFNYYYGR